MYVCVCVWYSFGKIIKLCSAVITVEETKGDGLSLVVVVMVAVILSSHL